jgi:lipopolysaccharide transport system permease protein
MTESLGAAAQDLRQALADWPLWTGLARQNIRTAYRRSRLGPFWITLAAAANIATLGALVLLLFQARATELLPSVGLGYLMWWLISRMLAEGCTTYIDAAPYLRQIRQPLCLYPLWTVARNLMVFAHHVPVAVLLLAACGVRPSAPTALVALTFPAAVLAVAWLVIVLGLVSARYRDVPQLATSILGILFYLTPVFWQTKQLGAHAFLADWNPLTHVIEIVRRPLLGEWPTAVSVAVVAALVVGGWLAALLCVGRCRSSLAYWV